MMRRRLHRFTIALIAMLSLLFSQLALANYVCPQEADMAAMTAVMEAGMPCDGMDQQQPALCHQHAADPGKTFEAVKLPTASLPMVLQVLELPLVLEAEVARTLAVAEAPELPPPPDPLFLSTLRLRV